MAKILTAQGHRSGTGQPLARIVRRICEDCRLGSHSQRVADRGLLSLCEIAW
jgi:hypothetical protein